MISRYQSKLSGPLLDRVDIHVEVPRVDYDKLMGTTKGEPSEAIRGQVEAARERQRQRFNEMLGLFANSDMRVGGHRTFLSADSRSKTITGNLD
jgi:magnesium chelatase family protein